MDKTDIVIVYLSLSLVIAQIFWMKAEKKAAHAQGMLDAYASFSEVGDTSEKYVPTIIAPKIKH